MSANKNEPARCHDPTRRSRRRLLFSPPRFCAAASRRNAAWQGVAVVLPPLGALCKGNRGEDAASRRWQNPDQSRRRGKSASEDGAHPSPQPRNAPGRQPTHGHTRQGSTRRRCRPHQHGAPHQPLPRLQGLLDQVRRPAAASSCRHGGGGCDGGGSRSGTAAGRAMAWSIVDEAARRWLLKCNEQERGRSSQTHGQLDKSESSAADLAGRAAKGRSGWA